MIHKRKSPSTDGTAERHNESYYHPQDSPRRVFSQRRTECPKCGRGHSFAAFLDDPSAGYCHGGCGTISSKGKGIVTDWRQLPPKPRPDKKERPAIQSFTAWKKVASYDYHNAVGTVLFTIMRFERTEKRVDGSIEIRKRFTQSHLLKTGKRIYSMQGVERELFQLPAVLYAVANGATVHICEGEKAALVLDSFLLATASTLHPDRATTAPGGSTAWRQSAYQKNYVEPLRGARVCLWPDDDAAGDAWLSDVTQCLEGVAQTITIVPAGGRYE